MLNIIKPYTSYIILTGFGLGTLNGYIDAVYKPKDDEFEDLHEHAKTTYYVSNALFIGLQTGVLFGVCFNLWR